MKNLFTTPEEIQSTVDSPQSTDETPVTEQIQDIIDKHTETPKKDNTMINLIIIALVIVVVIGLLVYYFKQRKEIE
jgi:uncharacterized protein HemX